MDEQQQMTIASRVQLIMYLLEFRLISEEEVLVMLNREVIAEEL